MSFRNTLILLAVLAVLGGVVFFVNRRGEGAPANATPTPGPLTTLKLEDVQSIEVVQGDKKITVQRTDDGWEIAGETPQKADKGAVEQAIRRLVNLRPFRTLAGVQDLDVFGLKEPQWIIKLIPKEGEPTVYHVGDQNPRKTDRYVQRPGDTAVYLVSTYSVESVRDWLDHPPLPPTPTPKATTTPAGTGTPEGTATPGATMTPEATATP